MVALQTCRGTEDETRYVTRGGGGQKTTGPHVRSAPPGAPGRPTSNLQTDLLCVQSLPRTPDWPGSRRNLRSCARPFVRALRLLRSRLSGRGAALQACLHKQVFQLQANVLGGGVPQAFLGRSSGVPENIPTWWTSTERSDCIGATSDSRQRRESGAETSAAATPVLLHGHDRP